MNFFKKFTFYFSTIGQFWQEKYNGQIFRWNLVFIVLQLAILFVKFNDLPPQLPLFYSQPWGESQLASAIYLLILPALSTLILVLNNSISISYLRRIPLFSRLLTITSLLFSIFACITLFQIISLVS